MEFLFEEYPVFKNESEMFNWMWENLDHVSMVSGLPLHPKGHFKWFWQFAHVLGAKGSVYSKWRLNPNNVWLMLPDEHHTFDNRGIDGRPEFEKLKNFREEMKHYYFNHVY